MSIYFKNGGAWKDTPTVWTKVSGVWRLVPRAWVKVSGSWKMFHSDFDYVPKGAIVPFYSTGADPTDWTTLAAAVDRFVQGWDGTVGDILVTGGSNDVVITSSSDPNHTSTISNVWAYNASVPSSWSYSNNSAIAAGGHTHVLTFASSRPARVRARLIQADKDLKVLPANAMCWAAQALAGLSELAVTDHLLKSTDQGDVAAASDASATSDSQAGHYHQSNKGWVFEYPQSGRSKTNGGTHSHAWTETDITWDMVRTCLKVFSQTSAFSPAVGMILGWTQNTAPVGFAMCDGSNGTIDLRDQFLSADDAETPGTTKGTGKVTGSYDTGEGGLHNHQGGANALWPKSNSYHSVNRGHSHAGTIDETQDLAKIKLAFIQKMS